MLTLSKSTAKISSKIPSPRSRLSGGGDEGSNTNLNAAKNKDLVGGEAQDSSLGIGGSSSSKSLSGSKTSLISGFGIPPSLPPIVQSPRKVAVMPLPFGTNESILTEIINIYNEKDNGLVDVTKLINVESQISKPKRQVTILLVGNHSAGKSSFINWYVQDNVMKTGVAIETQGISLIVHGSRRETLKGSATLQLFPQLKKLKKIPGVVACLSTEVSSSRSRYFESVTFIDTPGLVDGNMEYPFDINKTLIILGGMADMIFFFFEPIGQALCRRTLDILEEMLSSYGGNSKIRLYLAKADEAGGERDRQKVLMQIVQELCKRPGINRPGLEIPAIFIPSFIPETYGRGQDSLFNRNRNSPRCVNQIDSVCQEIEQTVRRNVQNALDNLDTDCKGVYKKMEKKLEEDDEARKQNRILWRHKFGTILAALFIFWMTILTFVALKENMTEKDVYEKFGKVPSYLFRFTMKPVISYLWNRLESQNYVHVLTAFFGIIAVFLHRALARTSASVMSTKTREKIKIAMESIWKAKNKQRTLYISFLMQSVPEAGSLPDGNANQQK